MLPVIEEMGMILGGHRLAEFANRAGFTDIQVLNYKIPCGPWAIGPADPTHFCANTIADDRP